MGVLLQEVKGSVALLTLNRPERRNALTTELLRALEQGFADAEASSEVDVIVLTGAGPAFCGGVDLQELQELGRPPQMGHPLRGVSKPVIGAVNGPAVTGGLELALKCDMLLASETASFADTHARLGLLPGWDAIARLPHAVGARRAASMLLAGRPLSAHEAHAYGLVEEVFPAEQLLDGALALAHQIAAADQPAVSAILGQLRCGVEDRVGKLLVREREEAAAWQGDGFDPGTLAQRVGQRPTGRR